MGKTLRELVKYQREHVMHMTQEQFSRYVNTDIRTVQKWESGESIPSVRSMQKIFGDDANKLEEACNLRLDLLEYRRSKKEISEEDLSVGKVIVENEEKSTKDKVLNPKTTPSSSLKLSSPRIFSKYNNACEHGAYKLYGEGLRFPCGKKAYYSNTLILGGPGSGKQRNYIQPNLLATEQSNFVIVTNNADGLLNRRENKPGMKDVLPDYDIKIINLQKLEKSAHCNPFLYFENHYDIYDFVNAFINETNGSNEDEFWKSLEKNILYFAFLLVRYLYCNSLGYNYAADNYNMMSVINLLEDRVRNEKAFEEAIERISKRECINSEVIAHLYDEQKRISSHEGSDMFILAVQGLLIRLRVINSELLRPIIENDDVYLYDLFEFDKKAVIINISNYDNYYNFYSSCIIKLLLNLCQKHISAQHIKFIIDEAASVKIDSIENHLAVSRGKNYSIDLIYQNLWQIKQQYPLSYYTIMDSCNIIFMGGHDMFTVQFISSKMGQEPFLGMKKKNTHPNEICQLPYDEWIVIIRGDRSLIVKKNSDCSAQSKERRVPATT